MYKWKVGAIVLLISYGWGGIAAAKTPLNPEAIPRYSEPLPLLRRMETATTRHVQLVAYEIEQQVLPKGFPKTRLWAYGADKDSATYPGPTIEAEHDVPLTITWANALPGTHLLHPVAATEPTLAGHLHGTRQTYVSNGAPMHSTGPGTSLDTELANADAAGTLWYHDNDLRLGELNRYAGLLGMYIVRDAQREKPWNLPEGDYEIPLVLEDKDFFDDGSLQGDSVHGNGNSGNVVLVNGKAWPHLEVTQHRYRFRVLNAAKQRFFKLGFTTPSNVLKPKMFQIGADGGYLKRPLPTSSVLLGPGEIADLIVDFIGYRTGLEFELINTAATPYPGGLPTNATTGQVMLFRMVPSGGGALLAADLDKLQDKVLAAPEPFHANDLPVRTFLVQEPETEHAAADLTDRQDLHLPLGTEIWEMINPTQRVHVLHVNSMHFQLLSRQAFRSAPYLTAARLAGLADFNADLAGPVVPPKPYLLNEPEPAMGSDILWKPTIRINPGEVTRFIARWAPDEQLRPPLETAPAVEALEHNLNFTGNWTSSFRACDCAAKTSATTERRVTMAADLRLLDTQRGR